MKLNIASNFGWLKFCLDNFFTARVFYVSKLGKLKKLLLSVISELKLFWFEAKRNE